eukprot:15440431-Alexandrium_andersonii.AAC.1
MPPPPETRTRSVKLTPRSDGPDPSGAAAGQGAKPELRRLRRAGERAKPVLSNQNRITPPQH